MTLWEKQALHYEVIGHKHHQLEILYKKLSHIFVADYFLVNDADKILKSIKKLESELNESKSNN